MTDLAQNKGRLAATFIHQFEEYCYPDISKSQTLKQTSLIFMIEKGLLTAIGADPIRVERTAIVDEKCV